MVRLYFFKLRNKINIKKTNNSSNVVNEPIKLATRFLNSTRFNDFFYQFFNANIKQQNLKKKKKKKKRKPKHTSPKKTSPASAPMPRFIRFIFKWGA